MTDELKPCPFCGGTNLKTGGDDKYTGVWCMDCEAQGPNHYGVPNEWGTRTPTPAAPQGAPEIDEADAIAEGIDKANSPFHSHDTWRDYSGVNGGFSGEGGPWASFQTLWNSINDARGFGWDANPWVVAVTFEAHKCNIDHTTPA